MRLLLVASLLLLGGLRAAVAADRPGDATAAAATAAAAPAGSAAAVPLADAEALPFFPGRQSIHVCTSEWSPSKPPAGGSRTVG